MEKEIVLFSLIVAGLSALLSWALSDVMCRYSQTIKNTLVGAGTGFISCILLSFLAQWLYVQYIKSQIRTVYDAMSYIAADRNSSGEGLIIVVFLIAVACLLIACAVIYNKIKNRPKEPSRPKNVILAIILYLAFLPLGMLYTSWKATIVNIVTLVGIVYFMIVFQFGFLGTIFIMLLLLLPIASCVWIVRTVSKTKKELEKNQIIE